MTRRDRVSDRKQARCPECHGRMHYSETPVFLDLDGTTAQPPLWLCERCWLVRPVAGRALTLSSPPTPRTVTRRNRRKASG